MVYQIRYCSLFGLQSSYCDFVFWAKFNKFDIRQVPSRSRSSQKPCHYEPQYNLLEPTVHF